MPDSKISSLTELGEAPASTDEFVVVDKSDTTMSVNGTTKKVQAQYLTISDASTTVKGKVELATDAETITGTDTVRAVTPSNITAKIDTDVTLAGNLDTRIPSQKAVKTYADALTRYSNLNASEGFLLNGKISVTVASNNITLALKGWDGNDPSATNPVYCRIGGVLRSVTAALSVTKNAGTNWFNSGSAELATKEIDYFAYLGYNATDGVVLGFSRIPSASKYGDFSTTTTNEKYCAISTITNAASTDYYNVIGRFAATLSAGAGYTWSVPTFTAINLVQRPIYETRTLSYTPTWTNLTVGNATNAGYYKILEKTIFVQQSLVFGSTSSVSATGEKSFNVPMSLYFGATFFNSCRLLDNGTADYTGIIFVSSTTDIIVRLQTASGTYLTNSAITNTVPFTWTTGDIISSAFSSILS